jgi:hypothetical protein
MSLPLQFQPRDSVLISGLSQPYCFTSPERFALDIVAGMTGFIIGGFVGIIAQEATPAVSDRDKLWWKLTSGGGPATPPGPYQYIGGYWVYPNLEPSDSPVRRFVECAEADIWAYDGGDGTDPSTNTPTGVSGAMWEKDANYSARMAIGSGTLSPSTTVITPGDTGGADEVVLLEGNIPEHQHTINTINEGKVGDSLHTTANPDDIGGFPVTSSQKTNYWGGTGATPGSKTTDPTATISPYRAGFYIKRTARTYYVG